MFVSTCTSEKNDETLKEWKKTRGTLQDHEVTQPQNHTTDNTLSPEKNKKQKNFKERLEDLFKQRTYKEQPGSSPQKKFMEEISYDDAFLISLPPLTTNQIIHQDQRNPLSTILHVGETVDSSGGSNKEFLDNCNFTPPQGGQTLSEFDILNDSNFKSKFSLEGLSEGGSLYGDDDFSLEQDHPDIHNFLK
jgi:hypothetical protein